MMMLDKDQMTEPCRKVKYLAEEGCACCEDTFYKVAPAVFCV